MHPGPWQRGHSRLEGKEGACNGSVPVMDAAGHSDGQGGLHATGPSPSHPGLTLWSFSPVLTQPSTQKCLLGEGEVGTQLRRVLVLRIHKRQKKMQLLGVLALHQSKI